MKKILFTAFFCSMLVFGVYAQNHHHKQHHDHLHWKHKLLSDEELANEKEFKNLDEALSNPEAVFKLNLAYNGLFHFPTEILELKNLQVLNLWGNDLLSVPPEIATLKHLQELNLGYNAISNLPIEMHKLRHLKILHIGSSPLLQHLEELKHLLPKTQILSDFQ